MVSRWGSFSSAGRITLNLALIKAPKECIDYVIMHELCHFKVKHHGPLFRKIEIRPEQVAIASSKEGRKNPYV
jgi:predicted metal-dependent hydrolase